MVWCVGDCIKQQSYSTPGQVTAVCIQVNCLGQLSLMSFLECWPVWLVLWQGVFTYVGLHLIK